ncbi:polymer-forming cytoskeletal protein [Halorarius litoreus]|uniref:polymer-forming cytoskeletal protein n=1 Tax=Halorarius litoreus TaxID=2962676 RepID=UPI0020CBD60A|nr:polymer-forming cytoskeletal protein [Halorarius litoreus]
MSRRPIALLLVALLVLSIAPVPVAADSRTGSRVVVEDGKTVSDLTATAGVVVVRGTVDGDLEAYGGRVVIEEGGRVTGRLRASAGTVVVNGTVKGTALAYGGNVLVGESGRVERSFGGAAGTMRIDGLVVGDATVAAGTVTLGESATIRGDLNYDGELVDRGATIGGTVRGVGDLALLPSVPIPGLVLSAYWFAANAALGALVLVLFPRFAWAAANTIAVEPLRTTATGVAALVGGLLAILVTALTVVGIPLALVGAAVLFAACWAGAVLGRFAVGSWLLSFVDRDGKWASLVVGLVVVGVLVRLPVVGDGFRAVVLLAGLGTVVLGLRAAYDVLRKHPGGLTSL